jgi:hypothetical protein
MRADEKLTAFLKLESAIHDCSIGSKLSSQRGGKFRDRIGDGLRFRITRSDGPPKTKKENHIMKSRKNILTYIVAALSILVTSASSSPAAPAQTYHGTLTGSTF